MGFVEFHAVAFMQLIGSFPSDTVTAALSFRGSVILKTQRNYLVTGGGPWRSIRGGIKTIPLFCVFTSLLTATVIIIPSPIELGDQWVSGYVVYVVGFYAAWERKTFGVAAGHRFARGYSRHRLRNRPEPKIHRRGRRLRNIE